MSSSGAAGRAPRVGPAPPRPGVLPPLLGRPCNPASGRPEMQPDVTRYYFGRVTDTWAVFNGHCSSLVPLWVATASGTAWERSLSADDLAGFETQQRVVW